MSQTNSHPLPVAQEERPNATRPRGFSFHSHKSHKSTSSSGAPAEKLHETHNEKEYRRLKGKADPSAAMTEAQPSVVAQLATSLAPIRGIQHRDTQGNIITDPDRSNPTRSRWERPLDTIRAFEAAIDGNYKRQNSRADASEVGSTYDRRSSYYSTAGGSQVNARYAPNGYRGRTQPSYYRSESTYGDGRMHSGMRPDSYADSANNGYLPNRARYPRTASEPHFNTGGAYPSPGAHQSYDTTSGSGSSDPAGYTTDPSSENSSLDRIQAIPREPVDTYGFNGFGTGANENMPTGAPRQGSGYPNQATPRQPIKLGTLVGTPSPVPAEALAAPPGKRKSWLGRRFTKADR